MKIKNVLSLAFATAVFLAQHASGGIVLQEDFSYSDGSLTNLSAGKWVQHSGTVNDFNVSGSRALIAGGVTSGQPSADVNASFTNQPYASNGVTAALYAKFTINQTTLPTGSGEYFANFMPVTFRGRIFVSTNGASAGTFRVGVANSTSTKTNITTDLSTNTTHTLVCRLVPATGVSTLWLSPANETSIGATATDAGIISPGVTGFALRQANGQGVLYFDDLVVGTQFADVVPSSFGSNPPFITVQPVGGSTSAGGSFTFSTVAGGDAPSYQWFKASTPVTDATNRTYNLPSLVTNDTGSYSVVVSNITGISVTSSVVNLTVSEVAIAPTIATNPVPQSVTYGGSATFSVVANGTDPKSYQWKFNGANIGANAPFYTVNNAFTNNAGSYVVIVTNVAGAVTSSPVTLTVTAPPVTNIAYLRTLLDTNYVPTNTATLFTVEGTVTTWQNLTPATNSLFYMQDATAGIALFWAGNTSASLPNAGDKVRVTAPLASFNGLLQFAPVATNVLHSITVISTNNPLPAAYAIPFDAVTNSDPAFMDPIEGSYIVASNVFIELTSPTFSGTCLITNLNGDTFTLFANASTDIVGQTKPTGPVTIYGVLGQFDTSNPRTSGYQLIPSRYADIVSAAKAATVRFTNVLANLVRPNGQPTNTFSENVVRPTESITMTVRVTDPDGGTVTIAPVASGLPGSASWTVGVPSGTNASAVFTFQPVSGDAGVNYTAALSATTASITTTSKWSFYVPTTDEQKIFISEILANPTSDPAATFFNPLQRAVPPTNNITVYDEYVEIVNLSGADFDLFNWTVSDAVSVRHRFYSGAPSESLASSNAIIVFGGPLNDFPPTLPVLSFPASESSSGLALNNGTETITLRNANTNIIDRLVYTASDLSTNGSITRFPTISAWFVPHSLVWTNGSSAGLQFNGAAWNQALGAPTGVTNITVTAGDPLLLTFTANTAKTYTLWKADLVTGPFTIVGSQIFPTTSGLFSISNPPFPTQFYFITEQ